MLVWPVKFNRSVVASLEFRGRRGVASSSSLDEVLFLDDDSSRSGRCAVFGVLVMMELRSCLEGDHASALVCFEGDVLIFARRVMSVVIAEMVLKSPTVSSCMVLSSSPKVKVISSRSYLSVASAGLSGPAVLVLVRSGLGCMLESLEESVWTGISEASRDRVSP